MEFDKLLSNCQTLEKTISILVKNNSSKQAEITRLQNSIYEDSHDTLNLLVDRERQLQDKLDDLRHRKNDSDIEIKQYSDINEKLSDLVSIVQKVDRSDDEDNDCKIRQMTFDITESLNEYEQIIADFTKIVSQVQLMSQCLEKESRDIKTLIKNNQELVNDMHRNDNILRLSEQQNKFAEQQFDLILSQIPWEPLTDQYIEELRQSTEQSVRNIAENLQLQKNEIEDLTETLNSKKSKKLNVLENLYSELNVFAQKRDEASMMSRFNEC